MKGEGAKPRSSPMALVLATSLLLGIYPNGHWNHATKLTTSNFEPFVKEQVDAGKTLFAPAWNTITKAFANNSEVVFGDVNLADDQVQGKFAGEPGAGGWPTIRTYSKETGYEGKFAGDWKDENGLDGAMCDVFGSEETMQRYVEEMSGMHAPGVFVGGALCADFGCLCAQREGGACSKQEVGYEAKFRDAPLADVQSRLKLLSASLAKSGKSDEWMKQRITILKLIQSIRTADDAAATGAKQEL